MSKQISQSKFSVPSTHFAPEQDFENLYGKFPERIISDDMRYEFESKPVFGGNYGRVFKGIDRGYDLDQEVPVAMKVLNMSGVEADMINEARGLAQLRDRGVMEVREIVFFNNEGREQAGVVYEWIEGVELKEASYLEVQQYINVFSQIAKTLDYVHTQNRVHNDIRPENILITKDDLGLRVVLVDWSNSNLVRKIRDDRFLPFASPNALKEKSHFLPSDDNYSMLVCIYYTLTGEIPFRKPYSRDKRDYIHLVDIAPGLSGRLGPDTVEKLDKYFMDRLYGNQDRLNSAEQIIQEIVELIPISVRET